MIILQLRESEKIKEGLRSLTKEFIGEYPYYSIWIEKNEATFKDGTRVVYELNDNEKTVGYMMVHFSTAKCAKINGIYVFPDCQKRGYVKEALLQALEELRKQNYDYAFIQTRTHNKIVIHMFDTLHFDVIGQNYHKIEKQLNWVAVYDLKEKRNFDEMYDLAVQLYPVELQKKYFLEQIKLANKYELPIIIHSRESQEDVYKILKENVVKKAGIMHCYSGTPEMSKKFIEIGYYLGVGGPVTRYKDVEETVRITSIDKIVIETDSPVLPPEPFEKHSRNNSLYLNYIVKKIAEIKEISEEEVAEKTTENAYKVYGINKRNV